MPTCGGGQLLSQRNPATWNRFGIPAGQSLINHLNQTFPECLRKRQIPMPDLRPTEPRPLVDQTWKLTILTIRQWSSNFSALQLRCWGVRMREAPKQKFAGWNLQRKKGNIWYLSRHWATYSTTHQHEDIFLLPNGPSLLIYPISSVSSLHTRPYVLRVNLERTFPFCGNWAFSKIGHQTQGKDLVVWNFF